MVWLSPDPWRPAHPQPLWQGIPPPILLSWLSVCPSFFSRDDQKATTSSCSCLARICGLRSIAVPARGSYNEAQGWIPPIAPSLPPVPCPLLYLLATHCRSCGQTYYSGGFPPARCEELSFTLIRGRNWASIPQALGKGEQTWSPGEGWYYAFLPGSDLLD